MIIYFFKKILAAISAPVNVTSFLTILNLAYITFLAYAYGFIELRLTLNLLDIFISLLSYKFFLKLLLVVYPTVKFLWLGISLFFSFYLTSFLELLGADVLIDLGLDKQLESTPKAVEVERNMFEDIEQMEPGTEDDVETEKGKAELFLVVVVLLIALELVVVVFY